MRYEAAGAIYHVMARGDGGKTIFDDDKDRYSWLDLMERAGERFGWRAHAWVLMGNHFHLLLETPEPNLVAGMKWMLGVYSQAWNRRRQRNGHVFQGRYKAVVVNGEEADGHYFKIVADYIHLNPVRSGWVGGETGKRLRSWRWSSFGVYAGNKRPDWIETARVMRAFQLSDDGRGGRAYAGYLEARALDAKQAVTDTSLKALRRGWCLGEKSFAKRILESISTTTAPRRKRGSVAGDAARAHDAVEAERIAVAALHALGVPTDAAALAGKGKWVEETALVAVLIRKRTGVRNRWVAERLAMGHEGNVTRAIRKVDESRERKAKLMELEAIVQRQLEIPSATIKTDHRRQLLS
ncbi:MAG: transposase [Verrucomicrobiota bacterium JB025]|nr:transposase [Verrucomicrobiota bacterium JB025]